MIDKYIKLREEIQNKDSQFKETVLKGKEKVDYLKKCISECEKTLSKGNGFSSLYSIEYEEQLNSFNRELLKEVTIQKSNLEKSKKELENLVKKNPILETLSNYEVIVKSEKYKESLITLVKGHKEGVISDEVLEKAKQSSLKFKEIELNNSKYMVKDNRTYYSDIVIFNQDNKILFVKRNKDDDFEPGKYALPGGHVEPAENPRTAAIRELDEEVGISVSEESVFPAGIYEDSQVVINYFCTKVNDTLLNMVLEERELQQYEWVGIEDIPSLSLLLNLKSNFENVIDIPVSLLNNYPEGNPAPLFSSSVKDNILGTGYPI